MTVAFVDADFDDLTYELNDTEIINDVLMIVGDAGSEVLVRGHDGDSIKKYGRRSYRIDRPIVDSTLANYVTPKAQAAAILDRGIEPYAIIEATILSRTDALTATLLGLEISDLVTVTFAPLNYSSTYFIIESIDLEIANDRYITATIKLVQARANEQP